MHLYYAAPVAPVHVRALADPPVGVARRVEEVPARRHHQHHLVGRLGILRPAEHAAALPRRRLHDSLRVWHERHVSERARHRRPPWLQQARRRCGQGDDEHRHRGHLKVERHVGTHVFLVGPIDRTAMRAASTLSAIQIKRQSDWPTLIQLCFCKSSSNAVFKNLSANFFLAVANYLAFEFFYVCSCWFLS
jgi:hypothetical protein